MRLIIVAIALGACGGQPETQKGACEFRTMQPNGDVPGQLAICVDDMIIDKCGFAGLHVDDLRTREHQFHPKKTCEAVGFARCTDTPVPFAHHRPCVTGPAFRLPAAAPGAAYVATNRGIAVIDGDGAVHLVEAKGWVRNLTLGGDGAVYATVSNAVWKITGTRGAPIVTVDNDVTALAIDARGSVVVAMDSELARDGKKLPASGLRKIEQLAFDGDGMLVAAGVNEARRLVGDAWQTIDVRGSKPFGVWLLGSGEDLVVAVEDDATIYKLVTGKLAPRGKLASAPHDRPMRASTGLIATGGANETTLLAPSGGSRSVARGASHAVLDGRGRLWNVDDGGLVITPLLGEDKTTYPTGTLPFLVEDTLLVVGGGPARLPAREAPRVVERVEGTLFVDGQPLANTFVEICTSPKYSFKRSPCEDASSRKSAETGADGTFAFTDVALGDYDIVFLHAGRWTSALLGDRIELTTPEPTHALGELKFETPRH